MVEILPDDVPGTAVAPERVGIQGALPYGVTPNYELGAVARELIPTAAEVAASMAKVEGYSPGQLEREVERWFEV